ncbi:MAG: ferrochelatase [Proteobacteria bacterium]|nr:ferrochelatase [Pseudomonadota bacterium]
MSKKDGVLLVNIGTPDSPSTSDVRKYLREFLMDPLVLNIPFIFRWILVHLIIAPLRGPKSAHAYQKIWTRNGSPLMVYSKQLADKVQYRLSQSIVLHAMRYQSPSIYSQISSLASSGVTNITMLPMFPQYSLAATESAVLEAKNVVAKQFPQMKLKIIGDFFNHPGFIEAQASIIRKKIEDFKPDHILMSYHGLPENHVQATDRSGQHCLKAKDCCAAITETNRLCYRAQSFDTSRKLASSLGLTSNQYSVSFQSRLGKIPWIQPFTDFIIKDLKNSGVKRLLVVCPSFVADCLETLEEIGIRCREDWLALGGEAFEFAPCVNADDAFADAVVSLVKN